MLPSPLHPAVVHFPIVLAFLLPLFVVGAMWSIRRGARARRAWLVPLIGAAALAVSAWAAVETGEEQDERVERVVAEQPLGAHEEMAETFLAGSVVLALIAAAGLVGGTAGRLARVVTGAGAVGLIVMAARVGHSGGELVYRHGAASAYTPRVARNGASSGESGSLAPASERRDNDDERR